MKSTPSPNLSRPLPVGTDSLPCNAQWWQQMAAAQGVVKATSCRPQSHPMRTKAPGEKPALTRGQMGMWEASTSFRSRAASCRRSSEGWWEMVWVAE